MSALVMWSLWLAMIDDLEGHLQVLLGEVFPINGRRQELVVADLEVSNNTPIVP